MVWRPAKVGIRWRINLLGRLYTPARFSLLPVNCCNRSRQNVGRERVLPLIPRSRSRDHPQNRDDSSVAAQAAGQVQPRSALLPPPEAGEPANLASRAAIRLCSPSFSWRARAAMSRTASNSSRETRSMLVMSRSSWARARVSASRRTPSATPATSVTRRARSSRMRPRGSTMVFSGLSYMSGLPAKSTSSRLIDAFRRSPPPRPHHGPHHGVGDLLGARAWLRALSRYPGRRLQRRDEQASAGFLAPIYSQSERARRRLIVVFLRSDRHLPLDLPKRGRLRCCDGLPVCFHQPRARARHRDDRAARLALCFGRVRRWPDHDRHPRRALAPNIDRRAHRGGAPPRRGRRRRAHGGPRGDGHERAGRDLARAPVFG